MNKKLSQNLRKALLSFQHMFAMLGATVVVPILVGLDISITLISAGLGTIIFYFITKKKVPVFLGSSFAYLPAMIAIMEGSGPVGSDLWQQNMGRLVVAVFFTGVAYILFAIIIHFVGVDKIRKIFPARVVGPIIIVLGMLLVPSVLWNNIVANYVVGTSVPWKELTTALITLVTITLVSAIAKPKSFFKAAPILLGFIVGYIYAVIIGLVDFSAMKGSDIIIFQSLGDKLGFYKYLKFDLNAILMMVPLAFVTLMEHISDISANSSVCKQDFFTDPGIDRTLAGDGAAIIAASLIGGPPQTTYGENTAILVITENYDPKNIFWAAILAVIFGVLSIFSSFVTTIPGAVIGGASIILFGMISASGLRMIIENKTDVGQTKNLLIISITLALGLGLGSLNVASDILTQLNVTAIDPNSLKVMIGNVQISPLAIVTVVAVLLNLLIPEPKSVKEEIPPLS